MENLEEGIDKILGKEELIKKKERNYDHIKPWQFKPGVSGNPGGRPKGCKSMKQYVKEYLYSLPDDEKLNFLKGLSKETIWKMAEGNPEQEVKGGLTIKEFLNKLKNKDGEPDENTNRDGAEDTGQGLEDESSLQDSGQGEEKDSI